MKIIKTINAMAVALIASIVFSSSAFAQTTILVVDHQRVITDSDVGKHVLRQLESIGKQMTSEVTSERTPIISQGKALNTEITNVGQSGLSTRPDLQTRAQDLQVKMAASQREEKFKQLELQQTKQKALNAVLKKVDTILETIVKERNADILIDRAAIMYATPAIDITDTVISRLNSQMRTVSVVRERISRTAPK